MNRGTIAAGMVGLLIFVKFVEEYWGIILPIVLIGLFLYLYPKWSHMEREKKLLDLEIIKKEREIHWGDTEMDFKKVELQARLMEVKSKMEKDASKTHLNNQKAQSMESERRVTELMSDMSIQERRTALEILWKTEQEKQDFKKYMQEIQSNSDQLFRNL